jgi:hypothetical protein
MYTDHSTRETAYIVKNPNRWPMDYVGECRSLLKSWIAEPFTIQRVSLFEDAGCMFDVYQIEISGHTVKVWFDITEKFDLKK